MKRHLQRSQLTVSGFKNYTILHSVDSAVRQIKVGQTKLHLIKNADARAGMEKYMNDLEYVPISPMKSWCLILFA
jgi:hypothetical protein